MLQRYITKIEVALQRALSNSERRLAAHMMDNHISVRYAIEYFK